MIVSVLKFFKIAIVTLALAIAGFSVVTPTYSYAAPGESVGDRVKAVGEESIDIAGGLKKVALLIGFIVVIIGIVKMFGAAKQNQQDTWGSALAIFAVGVTLMYVGGAIDILSQTVFGVESTGAETLQISDD